MITIKELAELCGVSISTVSRAMNARADVNPETRASILQAAEKYGYVPNTAARTLKLPAPRTVAVIVQGETSELLIQLLGLMDEALELAGYETFLCHVSDRKANAQTVQSLVVGGNHAGVIFLGRYGDADGENSPELSRSLAQLEVPFVFCTTTDFSTATSPRPAITVDDVGGAGRLTEHLLDLGHRHIAYALVNTQSSHSSEHAWMLRYRGYLQALESLGVPANPVLRIPAKDRSQLYSMSNAYRSTQAWIEETTDPFTAVVASCDAVGVGVMRALAESGRPVPECVSVTGFDGLEFGRYAQPSLTTLVQPIEQIAKATINALLASLSNNPVDPVHQAIQGEIFLGESTSHPPAS